MDRIDRINQLDSADPHESALRRAQRLKASFINTTMKVTLLALRPQTRWSQARW